MPAVVAVFVRIEVVRCPYMRPQERFYKYIQEKFTIVNIDDLNIFEENTKSNSELLIEKGVLKSQEQG